MLRWCALLLGVLGMSAAAQTWNPPVGHRVTYKVVDGRLMVQFLSSLGFVYR